MSQTFENNDLQSLSREISGIIMGFVIFIIIISDNLSLPYDGVIFLGISMFITLVLINLYSKFVNRRRGVYSRDIIFLAGFFILPFTFLYILNLDTYIGTNIDTMAIVNSSQVILLLISIYSIISNIYTYYNRRAELLRAEELNTAIRRIPRPGGRIRDGRKGGG